VFLSLQTSGLLDSLCEAGIEWLFISNVDNLGATFDAAIVAHAERERLDFLLEVTPKTAVDHKGGPIALVDGRPMLIESSQLSEADRAQVLDEAVYPDFNTNNLWVRVRSLKDKLERDALHLPALFNPKTVDGVAVVQLETAMGTAVACFDRVGLVRVDRSRFIPTKGAADLLRLRSDAFELREGGSIEARFSGAPPELDLDTQHFGSLQALAARFYDTPSLRDATSVTLRGDFTFSGPVRFEGEVRLENRTLNNVCLPPDSHFANTERIWE
jgi:UDP-N-acetylglucosamine pyrophosphorylase